MTLAIETITCNSETLQLTNLRAAYWEAKEMLILSDFHIGKTAHFRRSGVPISSEVLHNDLQRLKQLLLHFNPETLMIVGDLFHAELNSDVLQFQNWMLQFPNLKLILVKGNHDRHNFELYENLNIEIISGKLNISPFVFVHDIKNMDDSCFYISGHTHPGVFLKGKGKQKIKLPCFQVSEHQLILPAFSLFTGLNTNDIPKNSKSFAFTENSIFKV